VQEEGDVPELLNVEWDEDEVEERLENDFGDMPGAAQATSVPPAVPLALALHCRPRLQPVPW